jgi:hypothetical protein
MEWWADMMLIVRVNYNSKSVVTLLSCLAHKSVPTAGTIGRTDLMKNIEDFLAIDID